MLSAGGPNQYMFILGAIIMQDVKALVEMLEIKAETLLKSAGGQPGAEMELIKKIKAIYNMISMDVVKFRNLTDDDKKLEEFYTEIYDVVLKPIMDKLKIDVPDVMIKTVMELMQKLVTGSYRIKDGKVLALRIMTYIKKAVKDELGDDLVKMFEDLFSAITGMALGAGDEIVKLNSKARIENFINVFINILLPDLRPCIEKIKSVVDLSFELYNISGDVKKIRSFLPKLGETLGNLFGINSVQLNQVMGIIQGDPKCIKELVAPMCKIDSPVVDILFGLLKDTAGKMNSIKSLVSPAGNKVEEMDKGDWMEIMKKVKDGTADIRDLFQMIDMKGGKNGGISKNEFKDLLGKLSMNVTDHRVEEIFSKCKKKNSKSPGFLDMEGIIKIKTF